MGTPYDASVPLTPEEDPDWMKKLRAATSPPAPAPMSPAPPTASQAGDLGISAVGSVGQAPNEFAPAPPVAAKPVIGDAKEAIAGALVQQGAPQSISPGPQYDMARPAPASPVQVNADGSTRVPTPMLAAGDYDREGQPSLPSGPARASVGSSSSRVGGLEKEQRGLMRQRADLETQHLETTNRYQQQLNDIDQRSAQAQQDQLAQQDKDAQRLQEDEGSRRQSLQAEKDQAIADFRKMSESPPGLKVDPMGWWNNSSAGGKIGLVIAAAMQGVAAAGGYKSNTIGDIIERDIDAQKSNIASAQSDWQRKLASQHSLVGMVDSKMGDLDQSTQVAKGFMYDRAIRDAKKQLASASSASAKANGQALIEDLENRKSGIENGYQQQVLDRRAMQAAAAAKAAQEAERGRLAARAAASGAEVEIKEGGTTIKLNQKGKTSEASQKKEEQIAALTDLDHRLSKIPEGTVSPERGNAIRRGIYSLQKMWDPAWAAQSKSVQEQQLSSADFDINSMAATAGELGVLRDTDIPRIEEAKGGSIASRRALVQEWKNRSIQQRRARGD